MRIVPLPELVNEIDAEEFWNSGNVCTTKYLIDALEAVDKMLAPHGLEVVEYDAGMSDHVFTILERL